MKKILTAVLSLAPVLAGYAHAQTDDEKDGILDEVIVTAERRVANLQDTPISIASMSAEQIEQTGAASLDELQAFIPNLSITYDAAYGRANPQFNIRGVGSGVSTAGVVTERPVGLYIDGLYYSRVQGSLLSLIDAERIDVLRGPQGTLFGRNTTGGAIAFTTKAPTSEFAGFLKMRAGEFGQREAQIMVNAPIGDIAAFRATAASIKREGYVHRGHIALGNVDDEVARLQLNVTPNENLVIDLAATYSVTKTKGDPRDLTRFELAGQDPAYTYGAVDLFLRNQGEPGLTQDDPRILLDDYTVPAYCVLDDINPFTWGSECDTSLRAEMSVLSSRIVWDINEALSLTSITGYLSGDQESNSDWVWTGAYRRPFTHEFDNYSQEFQINWNTGNFHVVGGVIYFSEDARETEITTEVSHASGAFGAVFGRSDAELLAGTQITRRDEYYQSLVDAVGVFAQTTWSATDRLHLTAGLRYSHDTKDVEIQYRPTADDPRDETGRGEESWSDTDWRLAVAFDLNENMMIYASATDAYKAGIADDSSLENRSNAENVIVFIPPEYALGYETGMRSEWFDRRLRLNLSLYETDYTNRQAIQQFIDPVTGSLVLQSVNLGDVLYRGYEGDFAFAVTDALTVTGGFGVADYEREDDPEAALSNVPELSWTMGVTHGIELDDGAIVDSSLNYGWVDETYSSAGATTGDNQSVNSSYGLLSGRVQYASSNGSWSVALIGTNLLDEVYATSTLAQNFHMGGQGRTVHGAYRGRPRSIGLEATINFD